MDTAREGGDKGLLNDTKLLVNEHVVKHVQSASNSVFENNTFDTIKKFIEDKMK